MPTSPQTEVPGALALVFRYTISGYASQAPGVVLVNSDGAEVSFGTGAGAIAMADNADAVAASATANGQKTQTRNTVFNGTTWDRMRGDTSGTDMVAAARATAGGATQFRRISTADTNLAAIKASAGRVYGYVISNTSAATKYVKIYNKASAPVVATDVPVRTIMVPPNGIAAYSSPMGLAGFSAGIAMAATGAAADTDATALAAGDLLIQVDYA